MGWEDRNKLPGPKIRPCREYVLRLLFLVADQREHRSLRVLALDDPTAAGYLHGTIDDLAAAGFDTLDGRADGVDVEVKVPAGYGDLGGFPHHAAVTRLLVVALIEDAIDTHRPHVHIVELGPYKKFVVEIKSGFEVGRVEFVPADGTGGKRCGALRRGHGGVGGEDGNRGRLGIGHHGETKDAG